MAKGELVLTAINRLCELGQSSRVFAVLGCGDALLPGKQAKGLLKLFRHARAAGASWHGSNREPEQARGGPGTPGSAGRSSSTASLGAAADCPTQ